MKYQYFETLRKNSDFRSVYNKKKSFGDRYLVMYIKENGTDTIRLGVSVSKKVGNSIVRHRLARLIRESFRLNTSHITAGYNIVIVARASLGNAGYAETEKAMIHLLKLHKLYVE